ncbi:MAG: UDP-N-acetylmuramate dehydrogenase [Lachnospiraceae bacterium]|nr:UDP-N-acetylmuramate dehydrogenase [Lachnospiraceae bacterium]
MALRESLGAVLGDENVHIKEPMSLHTSFRAGGPADLFVRVGSPEQLSRTLALLGEAKMPYFILGRGTNLLVADEGYRGCIITMTGKGTGPLTDTRPELSEEVPTQQDSRGGMDSVTVNGCLVTAGAGASLAMAAREAMLHGLTGLEFAAGIPGSIGGGIAMNAGAYGGEMCQVTKSVTVLDDDMQIRTLDREQMEFGYRTSRIRSTRNIVLEAVFELTPSDRESVLGRMQELAQKRLEKQPLEFPSAGSTFKRPEGYFAGKLIMDAGLRGFRVGGACISEKHCGFVVNDRGASAGEIRELIRQVQEKVLESSGVRLEREVIYLG